ncbi:MAG: hypothetical protein ACTSXA_02445 [Candidatus Heimdallarchaeota archaeon]
MAKELVFRLPSDSAVESLIDRLEEKVELREATLNDSLRYSFRNEDRTFELQVFPMKEGELNEIIVKTTNDQLEDLSKEIFGKPIRESNSDASFLDVTEFIAELPRDTETDEVFLLVKEKFDINDEKLTFYTSMILKKASQESARDYLKQAAMRLS